MEKVKMFVKSGLAQTPLETVFWGEPTAQDYQMALIQFKNSTQQNKVAIQQRLIKKINKQKQSRITLACLQFLGLLVDCGYRYSFLYGTAPTINVSSCKSQTDKNMQLNFNKIFYKFIQQQNKKPIILRNNFKQLTLDQQVSYCEIAITQIKEIIHSDQQIINYVDHSKNRVIGLIILDFMLRCIKRDLQNVISFVNTQSKLILEENHLILRINYIYENLVACGKQNMMGRLLGLNGKIGKKYSFQRYEIDCKLNYQIEQTMKKYKIEYQQFILNKVYLSKLPPKTNNNPQQQQQHEGTVIDEDNILLYYNQFIN